MKKRRVVKKPSVKLKTIGSKLHSAVESIIVPMQKVKRVDGFAHYATFEEAIVQGDGAIGMDTDDVSNLCPVTKKIASEDNDRGVQEVECKLCVLAKVVLSIEETLIVT